MSSAKTAHRHGGVVVIGGGFAALESVLALRALTSSELPLTLVAPGATFAYRPAATLEALGGADPLSFDLESIANDLGVRYLRSRLEAVAPRRRWVRLASGARLDYQTLILAAGARAHGAVAGAVTFRDQRDVPMFRALLEDMDAGLVKRLVFAIPPGCTWPIPVYELALLSAAGIRRRRLETKVTLVSAESMPLVLFGREVSQTVGEVLAECDVRFVGGLAAKSVLRDGALRLEDGATVPADRVVAAPVLRGQRVTGVPANRFGFVPTDTFGRVEGIEDIFAVGDMTTFPIKHGGLATAQADRVAHAIAAGYGFTSKGVRGSRLLRLRLESGGEPLFLRAEVDQLGRVSNAAAERRGGTSDAAVSKVAGRYLVPYLERLAPGLHAA